MGEMVLKIKNLNATYGGLLALDKFNMDVKKTGTVGLIGPNGSGKTTLFNCISGLKSINSGQIILNDIDITKYSSEKIFNNGITRTFQRIRLLEDFPVLDNLMIGFRKETIEKFFKKIFIKKYKILDIEHKITLIESFLIKFNPNLMKQLHLSVSKLPIIDRRRIEVCRALLSSPKIILLDEPSAGMTSEEVHKFMDDLLNIKKTIPDLSIILIEHEMSLINRICDKCIVLNHGQKICEGTYDEVVRDEEVKKAYLGED